MKPIAKRISNRLPPSRSGLCPSRKATDTMPTAASPNLNARACSAPSPAAYAYLARIDRVPKQVAEASTMTVPVRWLPGTTNLASRGLSCARERLVDALESAQDSCAPVARRQGVALGEAIRGEVVDAGVHVFAHHQGGDVRAQRRAQLEAVATGARVDEDARHYLPDHRHPVRADVVQARPASGRHRILEAGDSLRRQPRKSVSFVRAKATNRFVGVDVGLRSQWTEAVQVLTLWLAVVTAHDVGVREPHLAGVAPPDGGDVVSLDSERQLRSQLHRQRPGPRTCGNQQPLAFDGFAAVEGEARPAALAGLDGDHLRVEALGGAQLTSPCEEPGGR